MKSPLVGQFYEELILLFCTGSSPSTCDYNMWPHLERMYSFKVGGYSDVLGDYKNNFPKFGAWIENMMELPAVKATYTKPEELYKFISSARAKNTQYDF